MRPPVSRPTKIPNRSRRHPHGESRAMQSLLVRFLSVRFGPLPAAVRRRTAAIADPARLLALAEQAARVRSLGEISWR